MEKEIELETAPAEKVDRRKFTSPENGKKGGRPRIWNVDPYRMIPVMRRAKGWDWENQVAQLERAIAERRKHRIEEQQAKFHGRPSRSAKQIEYQKQLRTRKLAELRHLRDVVRKTLASLEALNADDLDIYRQARFSDEVGGSYRDKTYQDPQNNT